MTFSYLSKAWIITLLGMVVSCNVSASDVQNIASASSIWKVVLSLVFIVVFIPACLWLLKKVQLAQMKLGRSDIKIVSVQSLGAKEKLMLVEVKDEQILIGVTPHNIRHIKSFPSDSVSFANMMNKVEVTDSKEMEEAK